MNNNLNIFSGFVSTVFAQDFTYGGRTGNAIN